METPAAQPNPLPSLTTPSGIVEVSSESRSEIVAYLAAGFLAGVSFAIWLWLRFYNQSKVFVMAWPMLLVLAIGMFVLARNQSERSAARRVQRFEALRIHRAEESAMAGGVAPGDEKK